MRGTIRHAKNLRVMVQFRPPADDSLGQVAAPWQDLRKFWAYKQGIRGQEVVSSDATQPEATVRFDVATTADIEPGMRIVCGAETFYIEAIVPMDRDMQLMTTEGTGDVR